MNLDVIVPASRCEFVYSVPTRNEAAEESVAVNTGSHATGHINEHDKKHDSTHHCLHLGPGFSKLRWLDPIDP